MSPPVSHHHHGYLGGGPLTWGNTFQSQKQKLLFSSKRISQGVVSISKGKLVSHSQKKQSKKTPRLAPPFQ
jgi:hypothetical protein